MNFSKNEIRLFYITIIILILFVFYKFMYVPRLNTIKEFEAKITQIKNDINFSVGKLKILRELQNKGIKVLSKDEQQDQIYNLLYRNSNLRRISMKPSTVSNYLKVEISCEGKYAEFIKFLNSLNELKLPIWVDSIIIQVIPGGLKFSFTLFSVI